MPRKAKEVKPVVKKTKAKSQEEILIMALDILQDIVTTLAKRVACLEGRTHNCACKNKK